MSETIEVQSDVQTYLKEVMDRLPEYLDMSDVDRFEICDSLKNNGVVVTGIRVVYKSSPVMPCIFPPAFYHMPPDIAAICAARGIEQRMNSVRRLCESGDMQKNWKDQLFLTLVNYQKNIEMLKTCVYRPFFDLAAVVRVYLPLEEEGGTILCTRDILENLDMTEEELFQTAEINTRRLFHPEFEKLSDFIGRVRAFMIVPEEEVPIYILTHSGRNYGAVMMMYDDVLADLAEKIGGSYYIVPSSIHEILAIPEIKCGCEDILKEMVDEVNSTTIEKTDMLSSNVYYFNKEQNKLIEIN